ncbi:unnamed protein product [Oncorhynchus mykiss]|uniref:DOCKER domain-containing protein n=1 Tax=Oncorhynchus mykiss TaxID=8022 RepID=A0A060YCY1_ONCMY|nr:unnamed protein product [Oncorhynchus mykiss]
MSVCSQAVFLRTFPAVYGELLKIFTVREVAGFVRETLGSLPATAHAECPLEAVKLHCIAKTVESQLYTNPESRCILLPVVLRLLQAHMQEQRDLVMCARILTSMLSLIRKDDSVTTVSTATAEHHGWCSLLGCHLTVNHGQTTNCARFEPLGFLPILQGKTVLASSSSAGIRNWIDVCALTRPFQDIEIFPLKSLNCCFSSTLRVIVLLEGEPLSQSQISGRLKQVSPQEFPCGLYLTNYVTYEGNWLHQILFRGFIVKGVNTYACTTFPFNIYIFFNESMFYCCWPVQCSCNSLPITSPYIIVPLFLSNINWAIYECFTSFEMYTLYELLYERYNYFMSSVTSLLELSIRRHSFTVRTVQYPYDVSLPCPPSGHVPNTAQLYLYGCTQVFLFLSVSLTDITNPELTCVSVIPLFGPYPSLLKKIERETWRESGISLIATVTRLMERLLDYRDCMKLGEVDGKKIGCTVSLLNFYKTELNKEEMYIRYIHKLYELHLKAQNYTEASYTLLLYDELLEWSDRPLREFLNYPMQSEWQRKEYLHLTIVQNFDRGKCWENGIILCRELADQYESYYDYRNLSKMRMMEASLYDKIMDQQRLEPEFFRVGFYGKKFPFFLRNKEFVCRGHDYERLEAFQQRMLNEFPHAIAMQHVNQPDQTIYQAEAQLRDQTSCLQVITRTSPVCTVPKSFPCSFMTQKQSLQPQGASLSSPSCAVDKPEQAGFVSLWVERTTLTLVQSLPGISRWFEVEKRELVEVSPLENAIEVIENKNLQLRTLIAQCQSRQMQNINPLTMCLNGVIDAAVNGGLARYQEVRGQ